MEIKFFLFFGLYYYWWFCIVFFWFLYFVFVFGLVIFVSMEFYLMVLIEFCNCWWSGFRKCFCYCVWDSFIFLIFLVIIDLLFVFFDLWNDFFKYIIFLYICWFIFIESCYCVERFIVDVLKMSFVVIKLENID